MLEHYGTEVGVNMMRKHATVEPERWDDWCDVLGILVWQDMPHGGSGVSPKATNQFETELTAMLLGRYNHPSIVTWVLFNENWGQSNTLFFTNLTQSLDRFRLRLVDTASGGASEGLGDFNDAHTYPFPVSQGPDHSRVGVVGEFGGLGLAVHGHTWEKIHKKKNWGYLNIANSKNYTLLYQECMQKAHALKKAGTSAVVYTQLTDVESEVNGLVTYDRAHFKGEVKIIASATKGIFTDT